MGAGFGRPMKGDEHAQAIFKGFDTTKGSKKKTRSIQVFEESNGPMTEGQLRSFHTEASEFLRKYDLGKRLSSGAQGVTYLATDRKTRNVVVVKKPNDPNDLEDYNLLITKTHPNIVRVFEYFHNPLETYIVMECCSGGDLFAATESLGLPTQNWCAAVFVQVCRGANYIHTQFGEAHCDLKPENILLDHKPKHVRDVPRAMVGDFGCLAPINTIGAPSGGDPRYRAPEIWEGYTYSACSDVWALGVTLYELVTGGLLPYIDKPNISGWTNFSNADNGQLWAVYHQCISSGVNPQFPLLSKFRRVSDLVTKMMDVSFYTRTALPDILKHPWFELADMKGPVEQLSPNAAARFEKRARGARLQMILLDAVAATLQGASLQYYRDIWDRYDGDGDGVVTYPEFTEMMKDTGMTTERSFQSAQPQALSKTDALWHMADRDGSGTISFQEFVALIFDPDKLSLEEKLKYFDTIFNDAAKGRDQLDFQYFSQLFVGYPVTEVQALFNEIDANRTGLIDKVEFENYMKTV